MKYSEHFDLKELVHPDIYNHPAIGARCADFIHPNTGETLDLLREYAGTITINDWMYAGSYLNSGLRTPDSSTGALFSAHRFGCGFDLKPRQISNEKLYYHILNNQEKYPFISRMEGIDHTPGWVHVEITSKRDGEIVIFNP